MRRAILAGLCILAGASQGLAAEATSEEAQRLVDVFHKYLGTPRAGEADFVRAEPQGEVYRLSISLSQLARPFESFGVSIDAAEVSFVVRPLPDGTWQVSDMIMPSPLTMHTGEAQTTTRWDGVHFDGIYDPALAGFTRFDETIGASDSETTGPNAEGAAHSGEQTIRGSASAADAGGVNFTMQQTLQSFLTRQSVTPPATDQASPLPPSFELSYGIDSGTADWTADALQVPKLLDLWSYAVAHASEDPQALDNAEIKNRLLDLLPLYHHMEESAALKGLRVETPFGTFGVSDLSGGAAFTGFATNGAMQFSLKLSGLSYPQEETPPWVQQLAPSELELAFDLSGFDLDAPARQLIEQLDLNRKPVVEQADMVAAAALAMPEGGVKFTLKPGHVSGSLIGVTFSGELTLTMSGPIGSIDVTATGLDTAVASLTKHSDDPAAGKALALLTLVQAFGQQTGDGATHYSIEAKEDGSIAVNGQPLKPPSGQPL
jgi:hypothetical protein